MFKLKIKIDSIDYSSTVKALLPTLMNSDNLSKLPQNDILDVLKVFVTSLENKTSDMVSGVVNKLDENTKNKILIFVFNMNKKELLDIINSKVGDCVTFKGLSLVNDENNNIFIEIKQVKIDYKNVAQNKIIMSMIEEKFKDLSILIKPSLKVIGFVSNVIGVLEKTIINYLMEEGNKYKFLSEIKNNLNSNGVFANVADYKIETTADVIIEEVLPTLVFPVDIAKKLMKAFGEYLKENINGEKND